MPIRVSTEQAKLMFGTATPSAGKPAGGVRVKRPAHELPENIVTKTIIDFLHVKGWICTRQQSGLFARPFAPPDEHSRTRVGEKGRADWRCERLTGRAGPGSGVSTAHVFDMELKAPGKRPNPHQLKWLEHRRAAGFTAVWFDSFNSFRDWYRNRFPAEVA